MWNWKRSIGILAMVVAGGLPATGAQALLISGSPARALFEQAVTSSGYTKIDFNGYAPNTKLTTQIPGLSFKTIRNYDGAPINVPVNVAGSGLPRRAGQIVGTPCSACSDDGRYVYEVVFATAQRAAGVLRDWNASSVTRFFAADGTKLGEFTGSAYVGWLAVADDPATYVKRIEFDGNLLSSTRQVGYSDDLIYGLGAIPEPGSASLLALGVTGLAALRRRRG